MLCEVLCTSASDYLEKGPTSQVIYLLLSMTNLRKRRFSARALVRHFPVQILLLESNAEAAIVGGLVRKLNNCYCLNLPAGPVLCRWMSSNLKS